MVFRCGACGSDQQPLTDTLPSSSPPMINPVSQSNTLKVVRCGACSSSTRIGLEESPVEVFTENLKCTYTSANFLKQKADSIIGKIPRINF